MKKQLADVVRYFATGLAAPFLVCGGIASFFAAGFAGFGLWLENVGHDYADQIEEDEQ